MNIISTNPNVMHWILYAKPWNCSKLWEKLKGAGSIARGHCDKWNQHSKPSAPKMDWITEEDRGEFLKMFPSLVKELKSDKMLYGHSDVAERFGKFLEHTVPHGKLLNSLTFVAFYKLIEDPARLTPQNVHLSMILGWCVQLVRNGNTYFPEIVMRPTLCQEILVSITVTVTLFLAAFPATCHFTKLQPCSQVLISEWAIEIK
uniref:Uncharacterized protein n=1 Tax=Photinus pyralis TaxID=7054 RepID=A0A1Y1LTS4_PHOPY